MSEFYALTEQTADKVAEWRDELPGEPVAKKPRRDNSGMAFVRITSDTVTAGLQPAEVIVINDAGGITVLGACRFREINSVQVQSGTEVMARLNGRTTAGDFPVYAGDCYARRFDWVFIEPCGTTTNEPIMRAGRRVRHSRPTTASLATTRNDLDNIGDVWVQNRGGTRSGEYASGNNPLTDFHFFMCEQVGFFTDGKPVYVPVQNGLSALSRGPLGIGTMLVFTTWVLPNGKQESGWMRLNAGQPGQVLTIGTMTVGGVNFNVPFWNGATTPTTCAAPSGASMIEAGLPYSP